MNPTNPQVDIKPTGSCEFWLRNVHLVKYKAQQSLHLAPPDTESHSHSTHTLPPLTLPEIYTSHMACIYNAQGKCVGTMSPNRFQILYRAFYGAKIVGTYENITPAPTSSASELQGLLSRKTKHENKYSSMKIKDSFSRALPTHIHNALQKWALVSRKNDLPSTAQPTIPALLECRTPRHSFRCPTKFPFVQILRLLSIPSHL
eukprot:524395-Pelagomonas_calceolata.AAC.1